MNLLKKVISIYHFYKYKKVSLFTYFIPAPPARKTGYREKSFDSLICKLIEIGFKVLEVNTQTLNQAESSGLWIIVKVQSTNLASYNHNPAEFPAEFEGGLENNIGLPQEKEPSIELDVSDEPIKGLYQID